MKIFQNLFITFVIVYFVHIYLSNFYVESGGLYLYVLHFLKDFNISTSASLIFDFHWQILQIFIK